MMKNLKICFFVPFYPTIRGGAEYQAKIIAAELQQRGHEIFYISTGHRANAIRIDNGITVYELSLEANLLEKITLYGSLMKKVAELIATEKPDIIYQRILNTFTYRLSTIAHRLGIPFILHIADNYCLDFSGPKGIVKKYLFSEINATRPYIVCQTHHQDQLIAKLGFNTAGIIPNMHPKILDYIQLKNKKEIVWIGNVRPVKQLEVFLYLAAELANTPYLFTIIGELPNDHYGQGLLSKINSLPNVQYEGPKENKYINSVFMRAGLLVNTSVSEGFSNTFIQAWMCGTPVLSLNSDPDQVMLTHGIGLNCNGDISCLKSNVCALLESEDYYLRCQNALTVASKLFSTEANIGKIEKLLSTVSNE